MLASRLTSALAVLLVLGPCPAAAPADARSTMPASWIAVFPARDEPLLRARGAVVWGRAGEVVVTGAGEDALAALAAGGSVPLARARDHGQWIYLLERSGRAADATLAPAADLVRAA